MQPASQPDSQRAKRDWRAAELPDEDKQGGKFQQIEGLTTVDAEEIPCEFPVEDDIKVDETVDRVMKKESRPSWLARRKNSTQWKHSEYLTHAQKNFQKMRKSRDEKMFPKVENGGFVDREFR